MPNKNFACLMAFIVALAELGAFFVQAASQDNTTNSYQANPANQPVPSQIQPTNQVTFSSAAEAEAQALLVSNWMEMVRSKREEPQVQMRIHDAGATAQGGAHRLDLDGNLNVRHAVRIVMADKQEMEGHVVSLAASDASGQRVWLGQVKDCAGEQIPGTTQVIYRDAFDSIKADVILGYSLNSVEQFVVFRERFELPASIDPATARLEAWTEWFQAPEPKKKEKQIKLRPGLNQDEVVAVDEELDFGLMRMIEGKAFMTPGDSSQKDASAAGNTNAASKGVEETIFVCKKWIEASGRRFLVESVDYKTIKSLLDQLPARQSSVKPSRKSTNPQALPALTPIQSSRTALLAQLTPSPLPLLDSPGVVLDYELVYSSLLNIQFGNSIGRKVGGAAVYRTTGDYWNWYVHPGDMTATMTNLLWSHEVGSPINMTVLNAPGQWGNTTGDAMFDGYIYNDMSLPITIGFSGIPAGSYDLYLYGHGAADTQYGRFEPVLGGSSCGIQQTAVSACWHQAVGTWTNGVHYVRYANLVVGADGYLTVNVLLDDDGYPIINGLQLAATSQPPPPDPSWTTINDNNAAAITYSGPDHWGYNWWVGPSFIEGDCHSANLADAYVECAFSGTGIKVIGDKDSGHGQADIYIDGVYQATIDSYSPTWLVQQELYVNTQLSSGAHTIRLVISSAKNAASSNYYQSIDAFQYTSGIVNTPPTISAIANQTAISGIVLGPINFTVGDVETPANLTLSAESSNPSLIPTENIIIGGSAANRTLTITPLTGQAGTATITVTVSDSLATASSSFDVVCQPLELRFASDYVNNTVVQGTIEGQGAMMAILVNSEAFDTAVWQAFSHNVTVTLGNTDGVYDVWVGVKGVDGSPAWSKTRVVLDRQPPLLYGIANQTTSQPVIQLQGYCPEPLAKLTCDLVNTAGTLTNEQGIVLRQHYDASQGAFTTNWFQFFDLELTNGINTVTIRAKDLAGNESVTSVTVTLDLASDTTAPTTTVYWPDNNAIIAGSSFVLRGYVDDPTATITISGLTGEPVEGLVERNGLFWVEDLPLHAGENTLTITTTDAAGNTASQSMTVHQSTMTLTIDPLDDASLSQSFVTVSGQIDSNDYTVWVNGVRVDSSTFLPNGAGGWTWTTDGVPLNPGGTAAVQSTVIPNSSNNGNGTPPGDGGGAGNGGPGGGKVPPNPSDPSATVAQTNQERPARVYIEEYSINWSSSVTPYTDFDSESLEMSWTDGVGGTRTEFITWDDRMGNETITRVYSWPADYYPPTKNGTLTVSSLNPGTYTCLSPANYLRMESCSVAGSDVTCKGTLDFPVWNNYSRTAQATVKLQTGGKAQIKRRNLFCLQATVDEVTGPMYNHWDLADTSVKASVPSTQVSIGGYGKLGSDGKLWVGLPDNESVDITPKTKARYYTFDDVSASKHKLFINANGTRLEPDRIVIGATNCVGQKITFDEYWEGGKPSEITTEQYDWLTSAKFVNHYVQPSSDSSKNYDVSPDLLKVATPYVWYTSRGVKNVLLKNIIAFDNGQSAVTIAKGKFSIYRPTIELLPLTADEATRFYTFSYVTEFSCKLKLGTEDQVGNGKMYLKVGVTSTYWGAANFTQLITASYSCPAFRFEEERCDGGEFYIKNMHFPVYPSPPSAPSEMSLDDGPSSIWISPNIVNLSCRDFVRFKPEGEGNIFVTLGIVTWETVGKAELDWLGIWRITEQATTTIPNEPDSSDEFPHWTIVQPSDE